MTTRSSENFVLYLFYTVNTEGSRLGGPKEVCPTAQFEGFAVLIGSKTSLSGRRTIRSPVATAK